MLFIDASFDKQEKRSLVDKLYSHFEVSKRTKLEEVFYSESLNLIEKET